MTSQGGFDKTFCHKKNCDTSDIFYRRLHLWLFPSYVLIFITFHLLDNHCHQNVCSRHFIYFLGNLWTHEQSRSCMQILFRHSRGLLNYFRLFVARKKRLMLRHQHKSAKKIIHEISAIKSIQTSFSPLIPDFIVPLTFWTCILHESYVLV